MSTFLFILNNNLIPVVILITMGFLLGRRFKLDMTPLIKLNFFIFVPAYIFVNLYTAEIPSDMWKVVLFGILMITVNFCAGSVISRIRRFDSTMKSAFTNSVMFYNSGNFGLPVVILVFSNPPFVTDGATPYLELAVTAQIIIMVLQNVLTNSLGLFNAGKASLHFKELVKNILGIPIIYMLPLALIMRLMPFDIEGTPVWISFTYAKNGLIAVALLTLGIQISKTKIIFHNTDVLFSAAMRLLGGPVIAFALIRLFGFDGIVAQALMISSSVPTAVNSALIAIEYKNRPDFASHAVMVSTLLSVFTVSAVIYAARMLFPV